MKLLLSSNGLPVIENLHRVTDIPNSSLNICWIVTAAKTPMSANYLGRQLNWFLDADIRPRIYDIEGKTEDEYRHDLKHMDVLFMEGGNTFYLLKALREHGFDDYIREWIVDKPYVSLSAGSYVACPTIEMATWKHQDRDRYGLTDLTGLGLVDFLITAHFKPEYEAKVRTGVANSQYPVKVLRDGQALLVTNDGVELLGLQDEIDAEEIFRS